MKKLCLYIAMSLDGYVADSRGGVAWLKGQDAENKEEGTYAAFLESIDTVLLGFKTYHQIVSELSVGMWPYEGKQSYVFTHSKQPQAEQICFTQEEPVELIRRLKKEEGKDIWLCGGAALVNQLWDELDVFRISVIPCVLGRGIPLFATKEEKKDLRLIKTEEVNGIVELHYECR